MASMTETIHMEVSQDTLAALKVGIQDFAQYVRLVTTVACFQDKKLSLGKAAQFAGYNRLDFLDVLAERGIVAFDYDESFVDSELQGVAHLAAIQS
jgi:predicted HTH domain antitoxin